MRSESIPLSGAADRRSHSSSPKHQRRFHSLLARYSIIVCLSQVIWISPAQVSPPLLSIREQSAVGDDLRLSSPAQSNAVLTLEACSDLATGAWRTIGIFHDGLWAYPDAGASADTHRFYRLQARTRGVDDDWKNQILYPVEPFSSTNGVQDIGWVKFAILLDDPTRVYFQDSRKFVFHYDFATQRLPPFRGLNRTAFDAVSLHRTNQQVVLGAVLYPPGSGYYSPATPFLEYGVQFVGLDPYTPAEIAQWYKLVTSTVYATNQAQSCYIPTFEQAEVARTNAETFAALGIHLGSAASWVTVNACYSPGWALGRLKYFAAAEVVSAYSDGRLRPEDILLTDGVPADTPPLAGIISLAPSTPNSHTAILAQSFGVPFVYLPDAVERARVQELAGHKIILYAWVESGVGRVSIVDVEGQLDPVFEAELLALKAPRAIHYKPKERYGSLWASTDGLWPSSIIYFGGKAANYGMLRHYARTNCLPAIAFSFDLWDDFLDQALTGGRTLRAEIAARLAPFTNYPPDIIALKSSLAGIRSLFSTTANFSAAQQQQITNVLLASFDPSRKIRFRSSTNVEDSEQFTGAGLYDSFSGCLLDDLDGDTSGPSQCDPTEPGERGVFRALRKVYASFYNDDAFLERLAHRVNEQEVGMAVLVHHSFPDEEELANGVATPRFNFSSGPTYGAGDLVTQLGAVSVTNPDGNSIPEIVSADDFLGNLNFALKQQSSLVPLGGYVMNWPADYQDLVRLLNAVAIGYHFYYPAKTNLSLDFEYKKDLNVGMTVKQVREVPQPVIAGSTSQAYLLDVPVTFSVAQTELSDVFACHRLKSLWNLRTANISLISSNLARGIYTEGTCEYVDQGSLQTLTGQLASWPDAWHSRDGKTNTWSTGSGPGHRGWRLTTSITTNVAGLRPPFLTQADFPKSVGVTYATPVPIIRNGAPVTRTNEAVPLEICPFIPASAVPEHRTFTNSSITIESSFYLGGPPLDIIIIWTAPLLRFVETRITGLTTEPIVLTSYYSQTYHPFHHNFGEECIFEPWLDPGLSPAILAELDAANIQWIYVWSDYYGTSMWALGRDQVVRKLD